MGRATAGSDRRGSAPGLRRFDDARGQRPSGGGRVGGISERLGEVREREIGARGSDPGALRMLGLSGGAQCRLQSIRGEGEIAHERVDAAEHRRNRVDGFRIARGAPQVSSAGDEHGSTVVELVGAVMQGHRA